MALDNSNPQLTGLAKRLVADSWLTESEMKRALDDANITGSSLVNYLAEKHLVDGAIVATLLSQEFGYPMLDLNTFDLSLIPFDLVPPKLISQHHALPLIARGTHLYVAVSDPLNLQALEQFRFGTSLSTLPILVAADSLSHIIESILEDKNTAFEALDDDVLDGGSSSSQHEIIDLSSDNPDRAPIVQFINDILMKAIKIGASDVHFEPYEKSFRVRARVDGVLQRLAKAPTGLSTRIAARLKVLAKLNIAERRLPQDGRMQMKISDTKNIDFRVSSCPTLFGEKLVLRILDSSSAKIGIDALGYEPEQKEIFLKTMHQPQGMILVTGPTGSGKTVSLYTALDILNTGDRNISTAEDPAEINLSGINQVNMHADIGLTFSAALRSFLRQDPDVIMIGEIRDLETAEIAIKAAQTGHMVLSTLHTNDAPQTITRLANMGVAPYNIASAVSLVIAQRLGRRLCEKCKVIDKLPDDTLRSEGFTPQQINKGITIYRAVGCTRCTNGYKGRLGIYQVMPISVPIHDIILAHGDATAIETQSIKEGVLTLRQAGLKKVAEGIFSFDELNRITKE